MAGLSNQQIENIDRAIYDSTSTNWRKVAMVVEAVLPELKSIHPSAPALGTQHKFPIMGYYEGLATAW